MADTYKVATLEECALLCLQLPEERREVFLEELSRSILFCALNMQLAASLGSVLHFPSLKWVDDDERKITAIMENPPQDATE